LVGLLAAGAILVSGVPAFAASGPGGDGGARTAQKADELLNAADKLTKEDSPARFSEGVQNAGSSAKQAGSATASNVQDVADAAVTSAKENLAKMKESFGDVMKNDKVSDASSAMNQTFAVSDASGAVNDAKSTAQDAVGDAQGFFNSLGDKLTGSGNTAGDVVADAKSKASDVVGDAQNKLPNLPSKKAGQNF
jgi:phage-related protein